MRLFSVLCALCLLAPGCAQDLDQKIKPPCSPLKLSLISTIRSRQQTGKNPEADDVVVQMIDRANAKVDFAVMGFSQPTIVDALERAYHRGVQLASSGMRAMPSVMSVDTRPWND